MRGSTFAGIDACRGGWCVVTGTGSPRAMVIEVRVEAAFSDAISAAWEERDAYGLPLQMRRPSPGAR